MGFDLAKLLKFFTERWDRPSTPVIIMLILLLILIPIAASINLAEISLTWWLVIIVLCGLFLFFWWFTTKLPSVPRGKVGYVVAITHEDPAKQTTFGNDFVRVLNELLMGSNLYYQIKFIELPRFHSAKIIDLESANKYLRRTKAHFLLYGQIRERDLDGKPTHFLNLDGIVTHSPIPKIVSQSFSNEMASVIPKKIQIEKSGDVFSFEFTARLTNLVSRYIIGTASLFSGDSQYAIDLFERIKVEIDKSREEHGPIAILKSRIPNRLVEAYHYSLDKLYSSWLIERDRETIFNIRLLVEKLQMIRPDDYRAHLLSAICAFLIDRDLKKAMKEIKKCRSEKDRTWYYSKAFIYAYEGKMRQAISAYNSVFALPSLNLTVPLQTEQFILDVLNEEPDRVQLYYCLGLINYHAKQDMITARKDFTEFMKLCPQNKFIQEQEEAGQYLIKIKDNNVEKT